MKNTVSYPANILKDLVLYPGWNKHTLVKMSMTRILRHLGYATRDEMTRILRHRAEGVKQEDCELGVKMFPYCVVLSASLLRDWRI